MVLAESMACARPLPGGPGPMYWRSFRARRPVPVHRATFQPTVRAIDPAATAETLASGVPFARIPAGREHEHALVVNLGGEFTSVDDVVAEGGSVGPEETLVELALTRVECAEGDPAPLDVFLIVALTPEILRSRRVRVTCSVRRRSHAGDVVRLEHAIPDFAVSLTSTGAQS